ncbi:restriction endonuclease fold toxin 5 domain-containing protein [Paraburkholderia sp. J94]|uniref:restriction endonuclease fold toxin 5 domain-containing protein n=1 Tax=Paraburkholderia sp. J94 TaxID=2805441 RepID=UPI002AAFB6DF|nr:restriction endonuclease fold toxin 5 domain-containing protein [Paraburkholderia sp. J94]
MNPEPRRYQARITGFEYGITTDGKGRETNEGWNMEWDWLDIDFDGFQASQCLLQEAKGNYDQFLKENNELKFPFKGFARMQEQIAIQGEVVRANPPSRLMWYFETPQTRSCMMNTLRQFGVPSVHQP